MAVRLENYLFRSDVGTYKEINEIINGEHVTVNGVTQSNSNYKVDAASDFVEVDGKIQNYRRYAYIMINKPEGYSGDKSSRKHKTIMDMMPAWCVRRGMEPVNKLDIDMSGLVLITDDMACHHFINLQKRNADKVYHVQTNQPATIKNVNEFLSGMKMKHYTGNIAQLSRAESRYADEYASRITAKESSLIDIKKMFGAVNIGVMSAELIAIGDLVLPQELDLGAWRELDIHELEVLHVKNPYY